MRAATRRVSCVAKLARSPLFAAHRSMSSAASYEYITTEKQNNGVAVVTLNRPKALNALCEGLIAELNTACKGFDRDDDVGAIVITGSEKAFAAGADIKEMADREFVPNYVNNMFSEWADLTKIVKPTIAAVNGFALGGGCELAMMCDIMVAGENAKFGQPEVTIGTIPGCGGTQRLIRAVGKSKAMEMCLTGDFWDAESMREAGLVSHVVPKEETLDKAIAIGARIASHSRPVIAMCKEAVNSAHELSLAEGVRFERRVFHSTFATKDQKEGMGAFVGKRKPDWKHE